MPFESTLEFASSSKKLDGVAPAVTTAKVPVARISDIPTNDTRRLADCFPSVDYFERRRLPFAVAVNCFEGARRYHPEDVRSALDLEPGVPVVLCDARQRSSARDILVVLVEHALSGLRRARAAGTNV